MSHPVIVVLACVFAVLGAILSYYFMRGFREGRMRLRLAYPFPRRIPDGREPGYVYRDRHPGRVWVEAGFHVFAILISIGMFLLLMTAP